MTAIRKTTLQVAYFQSFTNLTTDLCTSNDRFGFIREFGVTKYVFLYMNKILRKDVFCVLLFEQIALCKNIQI